MIPSLCVYNPPSSSSWACGTPFLQESRCRPLNYSPVVLKGSGSSFICLQKNATEKKPEFIIHSSVVWFLGASDCPGLKLMMRLCLLSVEKLRRKQGGPRRASPDHIKYFSELDLEIEESSHGEDCSFSTGSSTQLSRGSRGVPRCDSQRQQQTATAGSLLKHRRAAPR